MSCCAHGCTSECYQRVLARHLEEHKEVYPNMTAPDRHPPTFEPQTVAVDSIVGTFRDVSRVLSHDVKLIGERIDRHLFVSNGRGRGSLKTLLGWSARCRSLLVGCTKMCDIGREVCRECRWCFTFEVPFIERSRRTNQVS